MSPDAELTLRDVARAVVAHRQVHRTHWADGAGRAHWIVLWKVPEARERAAANAEAWERFRAFMQEVAVPGLLPDLDRDWLAAEAARLDPVVRHLAREHATSVQTPLSEWALRRSAAVLGSAYRNLEKRGAGTRAVARRERHE